MILCWFRCERW